MTDPTFVVTDLIQITCTCIDTDSREKDATKTHRILSE